MVYNVQYIQMSPTDRQILRLSVDMVHSYTYYCWLIKQGSVVSGHGIRLRLVFWFQYFAPCNPFSAGWPHSFMYTYQQTHKYTVPPHFQHTRLLSHPSFIDTHYSSSEQIKHLELRWVRLPHTERPFLYPKPLIHITLTSGTVLYYEMNGVTSRQCQGEENVSVSPWWAFPRFGSPQLMVWVWRALP